MLALTSKTKYGLEAILTLAATHGEGLLQTKEVAERQDIPKNYLLQVMSGMVKAGLFRTVRGKHGGYALAKPPEDITLFEVLEVLEGPLELETSAPRHGAVRDVLRRAEAGLRQSLGLSIAEIVRMQRESGNGWTFQI